MSGIEKGAIFTKRWTVNEEISAAFVQCSGDVNPIHVDAFAQTHGYPGRLMHGALLNALLSGFVGTGLPVKDTLCLMQKLNYRVPFFLGDEIELQARVTMIQPAPFAEGKQIVEFGVLFKKGAEIVASGELQVRVG